MTEAADSARHVCREALAAGLGSRRHVAPGQGEDFTLIWSEVGAGRRCYSDVGVVALRLLADSEALVLRRSGGDHSLRLWLASIQHKARAHGRLR